MSSLDKYTGPLYRRIADDVIDQIRKGTLHPGEKLPSERALCALYEVSQITVRRALRELGQVVTSYQVDWLLWLASQDSGRMKPYHRTRTIFY